MSTPGRVFFAFLLRTVTQKAFFCFLWHIFLDFQARVPYNPGMPLKIRELKAMLKKAHFTQLKGKGKGSHCQYYHPGLKLVTICGNDGDDAPAYLEKQVKRAVLNAAKVGE